VMPDVPYIDWANLYWWQGPLIGTATALVIMAVCVAAMWLDERNAR
jgi:hypothetical protein